MRKEYTLVLMIAILLIGAVLVGAYQIRADSGTTSTGVESVVNPDHYDPRSPIEPGIYVWGMADTRYLLPEGNDYNESLGPTLPIRGHIIAFGWDELVDVKASGEYVFSLNIIERRLKEICFRDEVNNQVPVRDRWAAFYIMPYTGTPGPGQPKIRIPRYMYDPSHPGYAARGNKDEAIVIASNGTKVPKYWTDYFVHEYEKLIIQLGQRFASPTAYQKWKNCIGFIAIGTGRDGETWPAGLDEGPERAALINAGLDSPTWIRYVQRITDAYVDQFRRCNNNQKLCYPLMLQAAPTFKNPYERKEFIDYGSGFGVGDSVNGLYPQQVGSYFGDGTGMYEPMINHPDVPLAFEGYEFHVANPPIGCEEDKNLYWALINSLDKHVDFLRLQVDLFFNEDPQAASVGPWYRPPQKPWPCPYGFCDFRPGEVKEENIRMFRWTSRYLGKTLENTPSVWAVMRDYRVPWSTCWKIDTSDVGFEPGNFEYWLYQKDDLPGGLTVPETNEEVNFGGKRIIQIGQNFNPYNPDLPPNLKEAWYIRRTDEASGNPYMFFDVEDNYLWGGSATVTVTITYIDMFTDTFSLHYQAVDQVDKVAPVQAVYEIPAVYAPRSEWTQVTSIPAGTTAVPKQGTKTLRAAVFVLNDARFHNDLPEGTGGADFYVSSNRDGNEWIHMVDVSVDRASVTPEPTPTPTPTPTSTPTATPSPTPTPTTARVEGKVWNDLNHNYVLDPDEPGVPGTTLRLLDAATSSARYTTTTSADGAYVFAAVVPGSYKLEVIPPSGYEAPVPFNQPFDIGNLVAGNTYSDINVPLIQLPTPTPTATPTPTPAVIQGRVFEDANANGTYDAGEPGLANVEVALYQVQGGIAASPVATTTTAADGTFTFTNLADGTYRVVQTRLRDYLASNGYEREVTVMRGHTYDLSFPNRAIAQRTYVPLVER